MKILFYINYFSLKTLLYLIVNLYDLWNQNNIVVRNKENTKQIVHGTHSNFMR
jgi:hypothetical protein